MQNTQNTQNTQETQETSKPLKVKKFTDFSEELKKGALLTYYIALVLLIISIFVFMRFVYKKHFKLSYKESLVSKITSLTTNVLDVLGFSTVLLVVFLFSGIAYYIYHALGETSLLKIFGKVQSTYDNLQKLKNEVAKPLAATVEQIKNANEALGQVSQTQKDLLENQNKALNNQEKMMATQSDIRDGVEQVLTNQEEDRALLTDKLGKMEGKIDKLGNMEGKIDNKLGNMGGKIDKLGNMKGTIDYIALAVKALTYHIHPSFRSTPMGVPRLEPPSGDFENTSGRIAGNLRPQYLLNSPFTSNSRALLGPLGPSSENFAIIVKTQIKPLYQSITAIVNELKHIRNSNLEAHRAVIDSIQLSADRVIERVENVGDNVVAMRNELRQVHTLLIALLKAASLNAPTIDSLTQTSIIHGPIANISNLHR